MTVIYHRKKAVIEGVCTVEEAEDLLQWLIKHPGRNVDLQGAQHLHTAVVQALMALKPGIQGEPKNDFLRSHVVPLLDSRQSR